MVVDHTIGPPIPWPRMPLFGRTRMLPFFYLFNVLRGQIGLNVSSKWLKPFHSNGLNGGIFLKDVSHQSIFEPGSNEQWHRLWPHRSHKVLVFFPLPCPPSCALLVLFCVSVWSASHTARQETVRTECEDRTLEDLGLATINVHRLKLQQVFGKILDRLRRNHTSPGLSLAAP